MNKGLSFTITFLLSGLSLISQTFIIDGDLRVRPEYRHGFSTMIPDSTNGVFFVNQRSRITFEYTNEKVKFKVSPQNVTTWGDVTTTSRTDLNQSFHEAFGEVYLNKILALKVGRQELNYDDSRIFGSVDWIMQARSHDAIIFKFNFQKMQVLHLGAAYNAMNESFVYAPYTLAQYKTLQFLWYHIDVKTLGLSFLALNNGTTVNSKSGQKIVFSQTFGPRLTYTKNKFEAQATTYFQLGNIGNNPVNSSYYAAYFGYKVIEILSLGAGFELISGKSTNDASTTVKSFFPLYGTNHKFNGNMDYFYAGNFENSVGLHDFYINFKSVKGRFSALISPHYFMSAAAIYNTKNQKRSSHLGTEIDFTLGYKINDAVNLSACYSQMFATTSMELVKPGKSSNTNNWAYISLAFSPRLFSNKTESKEVITD